MHDKSLPATPEEWADAFANVAEPEVCSHCSRPLSPALSITSALELSEVPGLRRLLLGVRREYGPWAVVCFCFWCGDVAVWPISAEERRALVDALTTHAP